MAFGQNFDIKMLRYTDPWAEGATPLPEGVRSADALKIAGLDFTVDKRQAYYQAPDGTLLPAPHYVTARTDNDQALGTVGPRYGVFQYREVLDVLDALVDRGELAYRVAGSWNKGAVAFLSANVVGGEVMIGGDEHAPYMTATTSHDGSMAVSMAAHIMRIVCQNTYQLALSEARGSGSILSFRHTGDLQAKVAHAVDALAETRKRVAQYGQVANRLAAVSLTQEKVEAYVNTLFPVPDDDKAHIRIETHRATVLELFASAPDLQRTGVRGTAWAAFQAVTAWVDHLRGRTTTDATKRLQTAMTGTGAALKAQAFHVAVHQFAN